LRVSSYTLAPLSLSFCDLADQSDWERGVQPFYVDSRVASRVAFVENGFVPVVGGGVPDPCGQVWDEVGFLLATSSTAKVEAWSSKGADDSFILFGNLFVWSLGADKLLLAG
jgi:hypothetical protein